MICPGIVFIENESTARKIRSRAPETRVDHGSLASSVMMAELVVVGRSLRWLDGWLVGSAKGTRRGGASTCSVQPYRRLYAAVPLLGCSQSGGTGRSDADRRVAAGLSPAAFSEGWISAMLDARREPPKPDDDLQPPAPTNSQPRIVLDASSSLAFLAFAIEILRRAL
ncbi:hypothetical protein WN51_03470 [Melipona quadrifasciata]|uniref:Uncharacterized protein n=1 Tax=Melipona quadrifasciata TaxID=166423 RepID=A0A0M8ZW38_9HYME|nr:hypothetical protein WN51_03470 [Melipona quadrifasciata]